MSIQGPGTLALLGTDDVTPPPHQGDKEGLGHLITPPGTQAPPGPSWASALGSFSFTNKGVKPVLSLLSLCWTTGGGGERGRLRGCQGLSGCNFP